MSPLSTHKPGAPLRVARIDAGHHSLHELAAFGIVPGALVHLRSRTPAFVVRIGETTLALDRQGAERIWVTLEP
jgi:Fe2+ transport system protein FeoA